MLKDRVNKVAFVSGIAPSESEYFEIIDAYKKKTLWLLLLFITRTAITVANGVQLTYYFKINKVQGVCYIPTLSNINWNFKQLIVITKKYGSSIPFDKEVGVCEYLDYNYATFAELNYDEAIKHKQTLEVPEVKDCIGRDILIFENTTKYRNLDIPFCHSSVIANRLYILKNIAFMIGSIVFGILGDVYGRRRVALVAAMLWCLCSLGLSSLPNFGISEVFFLATYFFNAALNLVTYINLLEVCPKKIRFFTIATFYGRIGVFVFLTGFLDFWNFDWNVLLYFHFCLTLVSLFHCWYVPESPRWLISHSLYKDSLKVMKEIIGYVPNEILFEDEGTDNARYSEIFQNSIRYLRKRKIKTTMIMVLISVMIGFIEETQVIRVVKSNFAATGAIAMATARILSLFYALILYGAFGKKYGLFWTLMTTSFASFVTICLRESSSYLDIRANAFLLLTTETAYILVIAYLPDLYPTFLRCTALGIITFFSSIARIVTVEFINWTKVSGTFIYVVFLVVTLPGFLVLKLPDTTLVDLPTTRLFRV